MKKIIAKHNPTIIAVVGSVGKTSTKFAIAKVLSEQFNVQVQAGNYNTPISVPFIFFGRALPSLYNPLGWFAAWLAGEKIIHGKFDYDVVVIELGTDMPGDIAAFQSIVRPTITVVSAISEEHMEFFADINAVAAEELSIALFTDILLVNSDDINSDYINSYVPSDVPLFSYGFNKQATYRVTAKRNHHHQFTATITLQSGASVTADVSLASTHGIKTVAAATAVADQLGMSPEAIAQGITKVVAAPGRMQLLDGIHNSIIIDDSYNASPLAVAAAITTLYEMHAPQRIAILGMMNELGNMSQSAHQKIGAMCDPEKLDLVITVGRDANAYIAEAAKQNGCNVLTATSPYQAAKIATENISDGAVILVKGSQNGVFTEEAVKLLLANAADQSLLVRQNSFWLAKKRQQFPGEAV